MDSERADGLEQIIIFQIIGAQSTRKHLSLEISCFIRGKRYWKDILSLQIEGFRRQIIINDIS
jgi:hypothetical protein